MPEGSSSQVVDGAAATPSEGSQRQTHTSLANSTPNADLKTDRDNPLTTTQRRHLLFDDPEDLLNVFHSPSNRPFGLESPQCPTSGSWQDASTEPLMPTTFNRTSPQSPYGSPSQRLELAHETRNPYLSPKRKHGPSREFVGKKQRTLALFTGDSWSDAPVSLVSSQSQPQQHQHQQSPYNPPTPFSQPKPSDKPSTRRDIFASPGKENLPPLPPSLPPPPKLNLLADDLPRRDRTALKGGRNDLGPIQSPVKPNDNTEQAQLLDRKRRIHTELDTLTRNVKTLRTHYQLVDKIGAGTFSAVYKAIDLRYDKYDNASWETALAPSHHKDTKYVALKLIHATSSPKRMAHEIRILKDLRQGIPLTKRLVFTYLSLVYRGASCVSQLITAFREHENVFLVMPFFKHDDFRTCYRQMNLDDIKHYFKSLLTALKHLHGRGILHRDIKPNNFLYNMELKSGMLIDFGLAQRQDETRPPEPPKLMTASQSATIRKPKAPTTWERSVSATTLDMLERVPPKPPLKPLIPKSINRTDEDDRKPGYISHDHRKSIKASRAGTRGFRAPEVLFSVTHQTVAIDIWSVGVILLSLLTGRYPFFIAHDEADSLIEIACLFGSTEMKQCAALHNSIAIVQYFGKALFLSSLSLDTTTNSLGTADQLSPPSFGTSLLWISSVHGKSYL
ncbi:hypothetical protein [Absidia glauca]|uniref:non-specific serine/threonine protein kinase n=1 Tax=Absidia glauca TaxID=4829 RepID=A0A163JB56_ABSGL|nr:hypothetical protein [Absidia glauca]